MIGKARWRAELRAAADVLEDSYQDLAWADWTMNTPYWRARGNVHGLEQLTLLNGGAVDSPVAPQMAMVVFPALRDEFRRAATSLLPAPRWLRKAARQVLNEPMLPRQQSQHG